MSTDATNEREWIKAGEDPLRYEYGRKSDNPRLPPIKDQLAYVEQERSGYFRWETYTGHEKGAKPSREQAQEAAIQALKGEEEN